MGSTRDIYFTFLALYFLSRYVDSFGIEAGFRAGVATTDIGLRAAQLLEFEEPSTGVRVILIGAMHYNPASIRLTKETIENLGEANQLGSVVVEACDIRWNKTAQLYATKPFLKKILNNEMRTACDTALAFDRPVILGDQKINVTVEALKASFKQTIHDILTPPTGWKRFIDEVQTSWKETIPFGGDGYLSAFAFFDPRLLLVLPVSLLKYPLSYLVRDPLPTTIGLTVLAALSFLDEPSSLEVQTADDSLSAMYWVVSLFLACLETAVFARLLLKPLLAERNEILAQNILDQCKIYAGEGPNKKFNNYLPSFDLFGLARKAAAPMAASSTRSETVYAPGSPPIGMVQLNAEKVVVAVLGMAHCNGIKRILCEESTLRSIL